MKGPARGGNKVTIISVLAAGCVTAALGGCAGRAPQPIAVVQPQDHYSDCTAIEAEVQANNQKLQALGSEEGAKVAQNVAAGVAGLFVWPLWFAMDFQGAAGKEETALQSRQQYLGELAGQRRCGAFAAAPPPPGARWSDEPATARADGRQLPRRRPVGASGTDSRKLSALDRRRQLTRARGRPGSCAVEAEVSNPAFGPGGLS